jgi:histidinol-phosphate phosphatase family protein
MKKQSKSLKQIAFGDWTLFLDRDGVINKRIIDDYVISTDQFEFIQGVKEALKIFAKYFKRIVIVTNQQGIGKGMMNEKDLLRIHSMMIAQVEECGGRIDKVYFCPFLKEENHFDRKPNVGMALKARKDFPEVSFKRSLMVGDSASDMEFGANLGMTNVFISEEMNLPQKEVKVDYLFPNLYALSKEFE